MGKMYNKGDGMKDFCRYAKKCNSCQLYNMRYEEQLEYKERLCRRLIGSLCRVEKITPSPEILGRLGYKARMCYPFDMFPHTKHVETCCLLTKRKYENRRSLIICRNIND